jgi:hypothetical protein
MRSVALAQAQERENEHDHHDQTNEINQSMHRSKVADRRCRTAAPSCQIIDDEIAALGPAQLLQPLNEYRFPAHDFGIVTSPGVRELKSGHLTNAVAELRRNP